MKDPIQRIIADPNVSPALRGALLDQRGLYVDQAGREVYVPSDEERAEWAREDQDDAWMDERQAERVQAREEGK